MTDEEQRERFAVPPAEGRLDGIDLSFLDPNDEDDRRLLIEAEHPDMHRAISQGGREMIIGGEVVNPALHISMHEVVANQLWADDPPEVWETAQRLAAQGHERHAVLHMLASVVSAEIFEVLQQGKTHDPARVRQALAALPRVGEQRPGDVSGRDRQNRAGRRARSRRQRG